MVDWCVDWWIDGLVDRTVDGGVDVVEGGVEEWRGVEGLVEGERVERVRVV